MEQEIELIQRLCRMMEDLLTHEFCCGCGGGSSDTINAGEGHAEQCIIVRTETLLREAWKAEQPDFVLKATTGGLGCGSQVKWERN